MNNNNNNKSFVSIIIPCYNMGQFVDEAVDSVLAQTYTNFEIIIIDDGSTENYTKNLLKTYNKPKTKIIRTKNKGLSAARNRAIKESTGDYILPLDSDDKIAPTYLEKTVKVLDENSDISFVTVWIKPFGNNTKNNIVWKTSKFDISRSTIINTTAICSLFKKKCWEKAGGYDENLKGYQDWDFWIALVEQGFKGEIIPEPLFFYRQRHNSMVKNSNQIRYELILQILNNHPDLYHTHYKEIILNLIKNNDKLKNIYQSHSWKITAPLRFIKKKILK